MACMTHECINPKCGHAVFNNSKGPRTCPKCMSPMISSFDEEPDNDDDRDVEDYYRNRE